MDKLWLITVYVPSTTDIDQTISTDEHKVRSDIVSVVLSDMFGGITAINDCTGGYIADNGLYIPESVIAVQSFTADLDDRTIDRLKDHAKQWCKEWKQETVFVSILETNGSLLFIR